MADYTREIIGVLMLALVPSLGLLAWYGVRRARKIQHAELPTAPLIPKDADRTFAFGGVFYVSTTFSLDPFRRVWAYGLGSRGRAELMLDNDGIAIYREGERGILLPWTQLSLKTNRAAIDRGTERDGLIQLEWLLGEVKLLTTLRVVSVERHVNLVKQIKEILDADTK